MNIKGKQVTVVGLGESGFDAAKLLLKHGAKVWVTDAGWSDELLLKAERLRNEGIEVELGRHSEAFVKNKDLIVTSPGVKGSSPALSWAIKKKIPIVSEIELASWFFKGRIVAVTGTNGKSTVTTLIGAILKRAGMDAVVCGNIGNSFSGEISRLKKDSVAVLEVSSFQLERCSTFRPKVAVLLNVSRNHLDRHADMREYLSAKARIFKNQKANDYAILNKDDSLVASLRGRIRSKKRFFSLKGQKGIGLHNIQNAFAASLAAQCLGVDAEIIKSAVQEFRGLEHRFEHIRTLKGVIFINDSKATTVEATRSALNSIEGKAILIAGGRDKGSDFSLIKDAVKKKVYALVLIGEAADKIRDALSGVARIKKAANFKEAVDLSYALAGEGDSVLLSPMCASFDMFKSFEDRGEQFKALVGDLR